MKFSNYRYWFSIIGPYSTFVQTNIKSIVRNVPFLKFTTISRDFYLPFVSFDISVDKYFAMFAFQVKYILIKPRYGESKIMEKMKKKIIPS